MLLLCVINLPCIFTHYLELSNFSFIFWSGMSYVRALTICLLLVYFVSAAGCHCFDLEHILELLQINGNWVAILRFCFEVLTLEHSKTDKYKLKVNKGLSWWLPEFRIPPRKREHNKVWEGGKTKATTCNIAENKRNVLSHNIFCTNIFDREQTSCSMIQQHTAWYNSIQQGGQMVQILFLHNTCCTLLYEKLGSFDRGLRLW